MTIGSPATQVKNPPDLLSVIPATPVLSDGRRTVGAS